MIPVINSKQRVIYYLAFFSRDKKIAQKFWNEAKKYSTDQMGLF